MKKKLICDQKFKTYKFNKIRCVRDEEKEFHL